jgi:O-antigen ligase
MIHLLQIVGIVLIVALTLVFMPHELVLGRVGDLVDPLASNTTLPRLVLAYSGIMAFADHPLVGVGIGAMNHPDVFFEYYQAGIIPVYSTGEGTIEHTGIFDGRTSGVHNMYIDVFASGGILLGLLFLGYLWQAFRASSHDVIKRRFLVAFLMYAMSWQFFSVSLGAFIIGLFFCCLPSRLFPGQGAREDL